MCRLSYFYAEQTTSYCRIRGCRTIPADLQCCEFERICICDDSAAEGRIYHGLYLHHRIPGARHPVLALHRRDIALDRIRVPEHGPQPHLGLYVHLVQHLLPQEVLRHPVGLNHLLQLFPQLPHPCPGQVVREQRRIPICQLVLDCKFNHITPHLLYVDMDDA